MFTIDEVIDQYGEIVTQLGYGRRQLAQWLNDNLEGKYTEHFARRLLDEIGQPSEEPPQKSADQRTLEQRLRDIYNLHDSSWVPVSVWGDPANPRAKWERRLDLVDADRMKALAEKQCKVPKSSSTSSKDLLGVVSIRDTHFGMFTNHPKPYKSYSLEEASRAYVDAGVYLVDKAKRLGVKHIVIPFGSDTLHVDGSGNTTTKGTPQEITTSWWNALEAALDSLNQVTSYAVKALGDDGQVTLVLEQGNHDHNLSRSLGIAVRSKWEDKVEVVDGFETLKRVSIGGTHVFLHHGDSINPGQYQAVIYSDHPDVAAKGSYIEVLSGHLHHRKKTTLLQAGDYLEDGGIVHRITPALCPSSNWSESQGYRSVPGAQLTVYSEDGFVALFDWTPAIQKS